MAAVYRQRPLESYEQEIRKLRSENWALKRTPYWAWRSGGAMLTAFCAIAFVHAARSSSAVDWCMTAMLFGMVLLSGEWR